MSDFRRRLMMQPGSTGESPEFIEFRYDKYVDTGVYMNSELKVSLKIRFHQPTNLSCIIGKWSLTKFEIGIHDYNWNLRDFYNDDRIDIPYSVLKVGNVIEIVKDKNMTYFDGILKAEHPTVQFNDYTPVYIGSNNVTLNADVYSFAIWQNDALIDEYYPFVIDGKEYFKGKHTGKLLEVKIKK